MTERKEPWEKLLDKHDAPDQEAQISAAVADAIEAWKNARQLPYLSPSACKLLNELIVAGLRPLLRK